MMAWLAMGLAFAAETERLFPAVRTPAGEGAVVDWTTSQLVVTASARRAGSEGTQAVEELARRAVDDLVRPAAVRIPLAPDRALEDLSAVPELWPSLEPRLSRWVETENRYFTSGTVEVVGAMSLVEALKPWTMASARAAEPGDRPFTGAVLDARGTSAFPCFAPVIAAMDGRVLYDGQLTLDAAISRAPAIWVSDAADPATDRAGSSPLAGRVARAEGCRITLEGQLAEQFTELTEGPVLAEGTLVLVVGP